MYGVGEKIAIRHERGSEELLSHGSGNMKIGPAADEDKTQTPSLRLRLHHITAQRSERTAAPRNHPYMVGAAGSRTNTGADG